MHSLEVEKPPQYDVAAEYNELLNAVEYHCSQCEAVYEDMAVLNEKATRLYATVLEKTKEVRDHAFIMKNWLAAYILIGGIRHAVCVKRQTHQICGIDSTIVEGVFVAIKDRLEFLLGFSFESCE